MEKKCSHCGNYFLCDESLTCWCTSFPKIPKEQIDDGDCMCRECLLKKYKKNSWYLILQVI